MKSRTLSVMVTVMLSLAAGLTAQDITTLTATETAGIARHGEPVTFGVPLPQGLVKDAGQLSLPTSAAFTVINRWPIDNSARWVLIDTQLNADANGKVDLTLHTGKPEEAAAIVKVNETPDRITVETGVVSFAVRRKGFRLFESMTVGGKEVLAAAGEGFAITVDGKRYTSANDKSGAVIVEESNPMRVALLASGKLADAAGRPTFDYLVRIHAYAGRPEVKVAATIIKKYGHPRRTVTIDALTLEMQLAGSKGGQFVFGSPAGAVSGKLDGSAWVHASSSTEASYGGSAKAAGVNPKKDKPIQLGWGGVLNGDVGVAAGVRRFWQTFPKAIEATADGRLLVHLYPPQQKQGLEFFTGTARTHEVLVVPLAGGQTDRLADLFGAFQAPLLPLATPKWYCRSGGLGTLAEADGADLYGPVAGDVKTITDRIDSIIHAMATRERDNWQKRGVTMDAYGWLAWGDTLHWVWQKEPKGSPWDIAWDSNYYDKPHMLLAHFARTGSREALDFFLEASWHLMDVDVVHWDPSYPNGGASRRCPATNHVGFDPPEHKEIIINVAFDHHKSESLFERYYLTGDRFALSSAMELLGLAFKPGEGRDGNYSGTRKPGHQIITLVAGYWATGDKKYLDKAREVIQTGIDRQKQNAGGYNAKPNFTDGICAEGFSKYYLATGDKAVLQSVKELCDYFKAKNYRNANAAMAHALVFYETGDKDYLDRGAANLTAGKPGHLGKDTPMYYRSFADFCGLVARELEKKGR